MKGFMRQTPCGPNKERRIQTERNEHSSTKGITMLLPERKENKTKVDTRFRDIERKRRKEHTNATHNMRFCDIFRRKESIND